MYRTDELFTIELLLSSEKEVNRSKSSNCVNSFTFLGWRHLPLLYNTRGKFENGSYKHNINNLDSNVNNRQENFQDLLYYRGTEVHLSVNLMQIDFFFASNVT